MLVKIEVEVKPLTVPDYIVPEFGPVIPLAGAPRELVQFMLEQFAKDVWAKWKADAVTLEPEMSP